LLQKVCPFASHWSNPLANILRDYPSPISLLNFDRKLIAIIWQNLHTVDIGNPVAKRVTNGQIAEDIKYPALNMLEG
jgi:hypothetical protein